MERYGLTRVSRDGDTNEIAIADDAVGGIEFDPSRSGQVDLAPA